MNTKQIFLKTAASMAIIASFGVAQAQSAAPTGKVDETVQQTQKPSSGYLPAPGSDTRSGPKVDDTVRQTQKASSGLMPAPGSDTRPGPKVDETVRQTQKAGDGMINSNVPTPQTHNNNARTAGSSNSGMQTGQANTGSSMNSSDNMNADGQRSNNRRMRMGNERMARSDRN